MNRLIDPLATNVRMRTFTWVLGLVFLLRALIPSGYMPDVKPGASSVFSLSLCITGLSQATVRVLALDPTPTPTQTEHPVYHCAFTLASNDPPPLVAFNSYQPLLLAAGIAVFPVPDPAMVSWLVTGPPLGSRAPPLRNLAVNTVFRIFT